MPVGSDVLRLGFAAAAVHSGIRLPFWIAPQRRKG